VSVCGAATRFCLFLTPLACAPCGGFPAACRVAFVQSCLRGEASSPVHLSLMHWRHFLTDCNLPVQAPGVGTHVAIASSWAPARLLKASAVDGGGAGPVDPSTGGGGVRPRRALLQMSDADVLFAKHTEVCVCPRLPVQPLGPSVPFVRPRVCMHACVCDGGVSCL
jgi:hypothetical protein